MMWQWFNWGLGGFSWIMPIFMIVFLGLVIWGIVMLVRRTESAGCCGMQHDHQSDSALEILKRRYASGEITKEEFEEKKRTIT